VGGNAREWLRIAQAGVPRLHAQLLRHTAATQYLVAGGDAISLQHKLGHTTLAMTSHYVPPGQPGPGVDQPTRRADGQDEDQATESAVQEGGALASSPACLKLGHSSLTMNDKLSASRPTKRPPRKRVLPMDKLSVKWMRMPKGRRLGHSHVFFSKEQLHALAAALRV
jgi:hypothetical protein